ncbi:Speckle-type POZ protein B [Araneus ventricosus]|uniref:Speckle-type POZ protein B n=1 Tax=Araneus ventricosus TaxID=182803 RepID=A0A4Y2D765_ARAVE|nr:Speckle-type POZ protein B [Araneus ventricosus]
MSVKENEKKCFTFIWKIENASYCLQKKGEPIKSPAFEVDDFEETKWKLWLYPRGHDRGNYVRFYLCREQDSKEASGIKIRFKLAFLEKGDSVLQSSHVAEHEFSKDQGYGCRKFLKIQDLFLTQRSIYLPQDTLTACCRMWKSVGELPQDVCYFARTRIGVEKRSFMWKIENFSTLELEKKCTYLIKSLANSRQLVSLDLSVTAGLSYEEIIRFEFTIQDPAVKFTTVCLFLVDASGNRVQSNQDEYWFENLPKCKQFTFFFTRKQLIANKSMYLPDDSLSLHWDWAFSKGIVLEEIEEVQKGCTRFGSKISDARKNNNEDTVPFPQTLNDNLKSLYDENFLCDVKLKTSASEFPAHKLILSASSSVFKAMFSRDMKEKDSNCVSISDLNDDSVSAMLHYIYATRVDGLTWEKAYHLYVAADKYAILSLKNICSSYMKDNLSPSNACEVLLLSDFHVDGDLKAAVQDYILKHIKDIVNSDEWKLLMETNSKLAAETLCLQYKIHDRTVLQSVVDFVCF